ncbi:MAG: sigma 54-interacting transcriptional regulator [Deltaproteobacteria bacterium]|nr:sigma 54-interacting transcriptional regulator [Deltaproteobacteria bacterium]
MDPTPPTLPARPDPAGVEGLRARIAAAPDRDSAARLLLGALGPALRREATRRAPRAAAAQVLRAMLHLRRDGVYEGLVVAESGGEQGELGRSTTAWRLVDHQRGPVVIDVAMRLQAAPEDAGRTVERLSAAGATHVLALPAAREVGAPISAMISLELRCTPLVGAGDAPWGPLLGPVQALVDALAPAALARPAAPAAPAPPDEALPVVGAGSAELIHLLERFAAQEDTILLLGETGTGKSRLAAWCHQRSPREAGPFQAVQVHTIPETLLEGELFGWVKGAHSEARADRSGLVARANGGTLFLDELHRMPLSVQARLLQLLDEKRYRRLGEDGPAREANVRIIAAASVDLAEEVRAGRFLIDLYYRVSALPVRLAPLRQRLDEVGPWARYMAARKLREAGAGGAARLSPAALDRLCRHAWPGNLRELDQVVRRAVILAGRGADGALEIDAPVVDQALGLTTAEGTAAPPTAAADLPGGLEAAARAWVDALAARPADPLLQADPGAAFKAAVWTEAAARWGEREAALRLGQEKMVQQRNHTKAVERERARWAALRAGLSPGRGPA